MILLLLAAFQSSANDDSGRNDCIAKPDQRCAKNEQYQQPRRHVFGLTRWTKDHPEKWEQAAKIISEDVPPLSAAIENEVRTLSGVTAPSGGQRWVTFVYDQGTLPLGIE